MLAARLDALVVRHIQELEQSAPIDHEKLAEALELLKITKLAANPRWRKRGSSEPTRPIMELVAADVDPHCAPRAAVEDFLANREKPPPEPRRRGRKDRRDEHHAWLLEKERP